MIVSVTGGTGMTGAYLLYYLAEKDYFVKALKRKTSTVKYTENIFSALSENGKRLFEKIKWIEGDIRNYDDVNDFIKGSDFVYHTAAAVSFKPKDKKNMIYNNVQGTANIVNACLENEIKKLCHVSSVAALGNAPEGELLTENIELTSFDEISDYAVSKFKSEREVWRGIAEGLNAVIVNPSIILGTGNWEQGSPRFIKTVYDGLRFYTRGINGFTDVRDVAKIMIKLTEGDISGERFIINSENLSFKEIFDEIADNLGRKRPDIFANNFMLKTIMYFDSVRYLFTGKEPRVTKYTVKSAQSRHGCSSDKIKKVLSYEFIPVRKSLKDFCEIFLKEIKSN